MKLAAIDIGSNAARVLINEVTTDENGETEFTKLNLLRIPLRLGLDVFTKGEIKEHRRKMTIDSMKIFSDLMKIYEVEHYRACATSAMRDARNSPEIIQEVKDTSGIQIEVITGDEEAGIILDNHIAETMDNDYSYLYIDVGGGSTEIMHFQNGELKYKRSFNIGTLRLLENIVTQETWDELKSEVKRNVKGKKNIYGIGSGGNINKVFSLSKTKDKKPLTAKTLQRYLDILSDMSVEKRMHKYSLRRDRADVIVPALIIFNKILKWADIDKIYVPKISVADGIIHNMYDRITNNENIS